MLYTKFGCWIYGGINCAGMLGLLIIFGALIILGGIKLWDWANPGYYIGFIIYILGGYIPRTGSCMGFLFMALHFDKEIIVESFKE